MSTLAKMPSEGISALALWHLHLKGFPQNSRWLRYMFFAAITEIHVRVLILYS